VEEAQQWGIFGGGDRKRESKANKKKRFLLRRREGEKAREQTERSCVEV
jgi:hypothetical protein